jgi:hypothetical protein
LLDPYDEATFAHIRRIQFTMRSRDFLPDHDLFRLISCVIVALCFLGSTQGPLRAQQPPEGPMEPPPEHRVARIANTPEPPEPPPVPTEEMIKRLALQEDSYLLARTHFTYRKTIRIQELGPDGKPAGEYVMVTQPSHEADGTAADRIVERPHSTLQYIQLESEDFDALNRMPAFPLTSGQLAKYNLKYLGQDQLDEISCYIFEVSPKVVERVHAFFKGIVWIDDKYLEVVKTYGTWVNDLGDLKSSPQLPFTLFETYREYVDGKYWFPTYARSDETLHLKDHDVPVRLVIKWTDFAPLGTNSAAPITKPATVPATTGAPTPAENPAAPAGTSPSAKPPQ